MPVALTVDTSPSPTSQTRPKAPNHAPNTNKNTTPSTKTQNPTPDRSTSPVPAPPYSPISPISPRFMYTHASQRNQASNTIPQPPPIPIDFEDNTDVIALKSAITVLQMQARNAGSDIRHLRDAKEKALADVDGFLEAQQRGEVRTRERGWGPTYSDSEEEDEDEDDGEGDVEMEKEEGAETNGTGKDRRKKKVNRESKPKPKEEWLLPRMQDVARAPSINWSKYAIVGESLDKIHNDQVKRPPEGVPQKVAPDGSLIFGGERERRENIGVIAPLDPLKDKIEGKKKGAKK